MKFTVKVFRGDTPKIVFNFIHTRTGTPLDLSDWQLFFSAKTEDGIFIVDKQMSVVAPLEGRASVTLNSKETGRAGRYIAEVEARRGDQILTLAQGFLVIQEDVRK